jgi:hypothetical protein
MKTANNLSWKSSTTNAHYTAKQHTHQWSAKPFLIYYTDAATRSPSINSVPKQITLGSEPTIKNFGGYTLGAHQQSTNSDSTWYKLWQCVCVCGGGHIYICYFETSICSSTYHQQDAKLYNILYCCQRSTCFGRFLHPSSGAQNSKLYTEHLVCVKLACCYR